MTYLGLDLGTSGVKAVLVDADQRVIADATASLSVSRPAPGWSEQDPAAWVAAAGSAIDGLAARQSLGEVRALGLSGQMHGAVLLDAGGEVLRPAMLWNDTRAAEQAAAFDAAEPWRATSGNIVFPGFTAPKVAWVRRHEPEVFERIRTVLLPKDYLRLWLTGERVSDLSDASGTSWLDVGARDWSDALLAESGLSRAHMPALVEGSAPAGRLRATLAERWGLGAEVLVAGGGGDNAAAAVGVGVVAPRQAFVSLGTSGVLFAVSDGFRPAPETAVHTFCHALPGTWHQMGVILSATDSLEWLGQAVGRPVAELVAAVGDDLQAPARALFLPYLGGERTPHNDAAVRGALLGLQHGTDDAALTRAVIEGVTFALADCHDALRATRTGFDRLIAVGGGARSDYWLRAIATTLGVPVDLPEGAAHGAAFGAARLALLAASGAGPEALAPPPVARTFEPSEPLAEAFATAHARYRAAYAAVREIS